MPIEIKVPEMGESITEGSIADWRVEVGQAFESGDIIVEIETDKVTQELPAPAAGALTELKFSAGDTVKVGEVIAVMEEGAGAPAAEKSGSEEASQGAEEKAPPAAASSGPTNDTLPPGARRMVAEHDLNPADIQGTGKRGQVTKADVVNHLDKAPAAPAGKGNDKKEAPASPPPAQRNPSSMSPEEREKLVPMSRLRQRIAERLVEAQHTAAILTTFNEVDMSALMALRKKYKEPFKEKHGVGLGFMSFFTKASIEALKAVPEINAEIRGTDVLYKNYFDIGVAVGGPKGLVVPIVRDAQELTFAGIEQEIMRLAVKVRDGNIGLEDLQGGTFTISNGGVYGSMMSTPIINPPQSGILGMHNIVKRAVVVNDEIVIRPMMYIALSYDHRIVDGKGAVSFLVRVKECIEDPERMLLDI